MTEPLTLVPYNVRDALTYGEIARRLDHQEDVAAEAVASGRRALERAVTASEAGHDEASVVAGRGMAACAAGIALHCAVVNARAWIAVTVFVAQLRGNAVEL